MPQHNNTLPRRSQRTIGSQVHKDYLALRDSPVVLSHREEQEDLPYREAPSPNFTHEPIHLPIDSIRAEHSHLKALIGYWMRL